jgi:GTP-binding protein
MSRFLDEAVIAVQSGNGGRGCVSFRRERFIPKGGPDGGDGGGGGSVFIEATTRTRTLADFDSRRHFKAQDGRPGSGRNRTGKNGRDVLIEVPVGTVILDEDTGEEVADLVRDGQRVRIAAGGRGGKGNQHFATSTNRAPRYAQPGLPGESRKLQLSLKHLADIGLIGLPNAGKSTLLSRLTAARPDIADYPFTTLSPNLGVLSFEDEETLTVADIPGLIQGASQGRGLGHRFLKHIERTRLLLHLLDGAQPVEDGELLEDFLAVQTELAQYSPALLERERVVLINKIDAHEPGRHRDIGVLREQLQKMGFETLALSALTGKGIDALRALLKRKLLDERKENGE